MVKHLQSMFVDYWRDTNTPQRALFITGTISFVWMLAHIGLMLVTDRTIHGATSYRKAATFAETGWLMCWSVGYVLPYLKLGRVMQWVITSGMMIFAIVETFLVSVQVWRNVPSHYNFTTPLDGAIFGVMGGGAFYWLITMVILTIALFRKNDLPPAMRLAFRWGAVLMVIGGITGYWMLFNLGGIYQGNFSQRVMMLISGDMIGSFAAPPQDAPGGNIIMVHALSVHGLNVVPFAVWLLGFTALSQVQRIRWSAVATVGYVALTALFGIAALMQTPITQMSVVLWSVAAIAAMVIAATYGIAFWRGLPRLLRA